ncbi:MAG TPA: carboxypeptidase-like regulatory domain-containing protein [Puia sp.]|jgi:hypothetical protein|nr:carboxypeptidase-like regulatory domain-containing protein [Puia sp.]
MEVKNLAICFVIACLAQVSSAQTTSTQTTSAQTASTQTTSAQTLKVIGSIADSKGAPIPNASVVMLGEGQGTSTDAHGNFALSIHPGCRLTITAVGCEADTVDVDQENKLAIVLRSDMRTAASVASGKSSSVTGDPTGAIQAKQVQDNLKDVSIAQANPVAQTPGAGQGSGFQPSGAMPLASNTPAAGYTSTHFLNYTPSVMTFSTSKEDTKGSAYLFKDWCHGTVSDTSGTLIDNRYFLFNYDKMKNALVMSQDMKSGIELYKSQIVRFELKDADGRRHFFVQAPALNNGNFVECLIRGDKYSLYKIVSTKFKKADYRSDGLTESGNNYDEYIDDATYYVTDGKGDNAKKLEMKKKSILAVFGADKDKVDGYLKKNSYDDLDIGYVQGLVVFLNQP